MTSTVPASLPFPRHRMCYILRAYTNSNDCTNYCN